MLKVLVVGDGESVEEIVRELKDSGYRVFTCLPSEAPHELAQMVPAALIVDLLSTPAPDPAVDVIQAAGKDVPALAVIPAEGLALDGNDLGIVDFVLHPLRAGELGVRIRRLVRLPDVDSADAIHRGSLLIDLAGYRVFVDNELVDLTYKEYELLRFLATHPDRVFTREALLDKVWGYDFYGGARTVDVHIRRLRSKVERGGHVFIETVRSVGYRFHTL